MPGVSDQNLQFLKTFCLPTLSNLLLVFSNPANLWQSSFTESFKEFVDFTLKKGFKNMFKEILMCIKFCRYLYSCLSKITHESVSFQFYHYHVSHIAFFIRGHLAFKHIFTSYSMNRLFGPKETSAHIFSGARQALFLDQTIVRASHTVDLLNVYIQRHRSLYTLFFALKVHIIMDHPNIKVKCV